MSDLTELQSSQTVKIANSDPSGLELAFVNFNETQREILASLSKIHYELHRMNDHLQEITDME